MTRIPLDSLSTAQPAFYDSSHDYGAFPVQGGQDGLVIVARGENYTTAFVECFPETSFIRGEGLTLAAADDACWAQLQAFLDCNHEFEARGRRNGGGTCKHCGQFNATAFTPEQLGLTCTTCGKPTFHTLLSGEPETRCETHDPRWPYFIGYLQAMRNRRHNDETGAMYKRLGNVANHGAPEDPEALAWARANLDMSRAQS